MSATDITREEVAKNLVMKVKELLYSTSLSKQDWKMIRAIEAALKERDERAAKIVNDARFEGEHDLRSLVHLIRNEDANAN